MMRALLSISIIQLMMLTVSTLLLLSSFPSKAQQAKVEQVIPQLYVKKVSRTGKITFRRTQNLSFKTSGYLTRLNIDEGQRFEQEQVLASLDITELREEKNATYARLLQAKREVNRVTALLSKNLSSEKELDLAKTEVETTRAAYKVAYYNLEKSQIVAPFDGVVVKRFSDLNELQSPSQAILQVAALQNNLIVRLALTAEEFSLVTLKQAASVNIPGVGVITGWVSKVPASAELQSNLFWIEILLPSLEQRTALVTGQLVEVNLALIGNEYVYPLPIAALTSMNDKGKAIVAVQQQGEFLLESYTVEYLSNDLLYLSAQASSPTLNVVTQGWQHLTYKSQPQNNE